jgi:hypothetical protein
VATWDALYEATPPDSDEIPNLTEQLRTLKTMCREVMQVWPWNVDGNNKELSKHVMVNYWEKVLAATISGPYVLYLNDALFFDLTLSDNVTLEVSDDVATNCYPVNIKVKQPAAGGKTVAWGTSWGTIEWAWTTTPTAAAGANAETIYYLERINGKWYGRIVGGNYS